MKFCTCVSFLAASASWSSVCAFFPSLRTNAMSNRVCGRHQAPFLRDVLCRSSFEDDDDDFFSDYDPSKYESFNYENDDGVQYGGGGRRREGRSNNRDRGYGNRWEKPNNRYRGRQRSMEYTRDTSADLSNIDEAVVEDLIRKRSAAKGIRDYDTADAIRDQLLLEHHVGINDRERTWRTGVSSSGSGKGFHQRGSPHRRGSNGRRPRQDFGPNGHDYELSADSGPNASGLSEQEIHARIAERLMAKLSRDFGTADAIQTDLVARGIFVHDGIKEWRWDGLAYGDFSERRDRRGNPTKIAGSRSSHEVAYLKSSFSADVEGASDEMIDKLVAERLRYKIARDFDKADSIREGLRDRFNVLIDDRLRMWSVGGDFGEEHNARRELAHQFATRGYIKSKTSLPLSEDDEAYIQEQVDERAIAKRDRDFQTADAIRQDLLEQYDVSINDKMKLWSAGGAYAEIEGSDSKPRGVYTRRGGGNLSDDQVEEIQDLLTERYHHKKKREFGTADAIRDDLETRFGVRIDDRSSEWRVDTDEYFARTTGNLSEEDIEFVAQKLRERFLCKRERDYDAADAIRDQLEESFGVIVDDRTREWKVETVEMPQHAVFSSDDATNAKEKDWDLKEDDSEEEEDTFSLDLDWDEESTADEDDDGDEEIQDDDESLREEELSKLTVVVLKEKLRDAGLPVSGKKSELVARLLNQ